MPRHSLLSAAAVAVVLLVAAEGRADPAASGAGASGLVVRVESSPRPLRSQKAVRWRVRVTNRSAVRRTLTFPSSKRAEVVLRRGGVVRYRWSEGRAFMPLIERRTLPPGKSWTFTLTGTLDVPPGRYDVVATLASRPAPRPARTSVLVRGP